MVVRSRESVSEAADVSVCPECDGSGWIRIPDRGAGAARRCQCQQRSVLAELLDAAGIPPKYETCDFDSFRTGLDSDPTNKLLRALSICRHYVETFLDPESGGWTSRGLLFIGPPGVGKTHLAVATLKELIRRYRIRGRFLDFTAFLGRIQASFDPESEESRHELLDPVLRAEVLVFDELGAQKTTAFVLDTLYLILNTRYGERKPTLFTTNFRLSGADATDSSRTLVEESGMPRSELLADRMSPRLVSRLYEMARPIEIDTADFRKRFLRPGQPR